MTRPFVKYEIINIRIADEKLMRTDKEKSGGFDFHWLIALDIPLGLWYNRCVMAQTALTAPLNQLTSLARA